MSEKRKREDTPGFDFIKNNKGGHTLLFCGRQYTLNYKNKDGSTLWRCSNRKECSASIKINNTNDGVLGESTHTCEGNYTKNEVLVLMEKCKEKVTEDFKPVQQIFEKVFAEHDFNEETKVDGEFSVMPIFKSKKDSLLRARRKYLKMAKTEFKNLNEVQVPDIFVNNFLVCSNGEDNNKILIFSTPFIRTYLKNNINKPFQFFGDGTFKSVPKLFYQLYTLHIDVDSDDETVNIVPVIYGLLPNKSQETYKRFFDLIKEYINIDIKLFKCDYELAQIQAIKMVFPNVAVTGCFYHYTKAVWKNSEKYDLTVTQRGRELTTMTANLPLLPAEHIPDAWNCIVQKFVNTENMEQFQRYFEKQWLKLVPNMLSCASETHRTNNGLEGWHRRINGRVPPNSTFVNFLQKLMLEAKWQDRKIKSSMFNRNNRNKADIEFNKGYKKELKKLENDTITHFEFIKNICKIKRQIKAVY